MTDKSCADGKYNESLLLNGFDKVVTTFLCLFTSFTLAKLKLHTFAFVRQLCNYVYANQFSFS